MSTKFKRLRVTGVGRAAARVVRELAEHNAAGNVVEVDSDEVGLPSEGLGNVDHLFERVGAGRRVLRRWKGQLDVDRAPIRKKVVDAVITKAVRMDLNKPDATVEDHELVVSWDFPVGT